jgi:hypothetical protein
MAHGEKKTPQGVARERVGLGASRHGLLDGERDGVAAWKAPRVEDDRAGAVDHGERGQPDDAELLEGPVGILCHGPGEVVLGLVLGELGQAVEGRHAHAHYAHVRRVPRGLELREVLLDDRAALAVDVEEVEDDDPSAFGLEVEGAVVGRGRTVRGSRVHAGLGGVEAGRDDAGREQEEEAPGGGVKPHRFLPAANARTTRATSQRLGPLAPAGSGGRSKK